MVFVDQIKGTSNKDCGGYRKNPCKQLSEAVKQVRPGGIIHIIDDQILQETIPISINISIITTQEDKGRIIGENDIMFAFVVKKTGIMLNVSNIAFKTIGVFKTCLPVWISLHNIFVYGTGRNLTDVQIEDRNSTLRFSLTMTRSSFVSTGRVLFIKTSNHHRK